MLFDYKFLKAPHDIIEDMYFGTMAVIQTFSPPFDDNEEQLYAAYDRMKRNIDSCYIVKLFGSRAAHYMFSDLGDEMLISDIYVYHRFRYHGIGTAIIRRCISDTEKPIIAYVHSNNVGAFSLFRKLGFVVTEERNRLCRLYFSNDQSIKRSVRKR